MSDAQTTTEDPPDPLHQLSSSAYRFVVHQLYQQLPLPFGADPEHTALLIEAAIARIASMLPANPYEAEIATRVVTADAQAADCIRHARMLFNDPKPAMQCHAMANSYMRTANAAGALLLRVQTARHKREALPANCDQDAWVEHCAAGFMTAAVKGAPAPDLPPPPVPEPEPAAPPQTADERYASYDEAEQYAVHYPRRAAEIRAHGGVPSTARYGHPEAKLVLEIIASTSPLLRQLDEEYSPNTPT